MAKSGKKQQQGKKQKEQKQAEAGSDAGAALREELEPILEQLGADSLSFLKEQAQVLLRNEQIVARRQKAAEAAERGEAAEGGEAEEPGEAPAGSHDAPSASDEVTIKRSDEYSFFVYAGGRRVFFSLKEMRQLTKICHGAESAEDAVPRLHRWLQRERIDVINEFHIAARRSPLLMKLYEQIVSSYGVKT